MRNAGILKKIDIVVYCPKITYNCRINKLNRNI